MYAPRSVFSLFAISFALLAGTLPGFAQTGQVVEATQPVRLYLDGEQSRLNVGDTVKVGDTVLTGEGAMAQIIFQDETRIVVGPNSQMKLDSLIFRNDNTAKKFAVQATRGTFRFLSGKSPSKAYSVRTPIATMGVRGTVFDFTIPAQRNTDLLVHDGEVQFCRSGRSTCAIVQQGCQTIRMDHRRWNQPKTAGERSELLNTLFPFAVEQGQLRPEFQTNIADCSGGSDTQPLPQMQVRQVSAPLRDGATQSESSDSGNPAD